MFKPGAAWAAWEIKNGPARAPLFILTPGVFVCLPLAKSTSRFIIMFVKNVCSHLPAGDFYKSIRPSTDRMRGCHFFRFPQMSFSHRLGMICQNRNLLVFCRLMHMCRGKSSLTYLKHAFACVDVSAPLLVSWQLWKAMHLF